MNSRRCISTTPLKDYAEYSRSAPCIAAKAGTLFSALGQERKGSERANVVRFALESGLRSSGFMSDPARMPVRGEDEPAKVVVVRATA